jgi:hypothetical protein
MGIATGRGKVKSVKCQRDAVACDWVGIGGFCGGGRGSWCTAITKRHPEPASLFARHFS